MRAAAVPRSPSLTTLFAPRSLARVVLVRRCAPFENRQGLSVVLPPARFHHRGVPHARKLVGLRPRLEDRHDLMILCPPASQFLRRRPPSVVRSVQVKGLHAAARPSADCGPTGTIGPMGQGRRVAGRNQMAPRVGSAEPFARALRALDRRPATGPLGTRSEAGNHGRLWALHDDAAIAAEGVLPRLRPVFVENHLIGEAATDDGG